MNVLTYRNVDEALPYALIHLDKHGVERDSRNGKVVMSPVPVATVYTNPCERVLFRPWRDANPFFHFYESLWMLAGRRDVAPLTRYVKRMASFSDDGETFNAAYGYRWRHATKDNIDQLKILSSRLERNPDDRRCVLQIWTVKHDLVDANGPYVGRDAACNVTATFQVSNEGKLDMVVFCRSNDIVWGCYGANAVHFSFLLEYMARRSGYPVGTYTQISVNWHGYLETTKPLMQNAWRDVQDMALSQYTELELKTYPLCDGKIDQTWDEDLTVFMSGNGRLPVHSMFRNCFFADVAWPIVAAHDRYKDKNFDEAFKMIECCEAKDWKIACTEWLMRRYVKFQQAQDDGPTP